MGASTAASSCCAPRGGGRPGDGAGAAAALRGGADDLLHGYADQGAVRDVPVAGRHLGQMRGYLVQPAGAGPFPAVLVVHENRGLNPYIEDVARRAAVEGFLALAPDGLFPVGGYPGNDDDGRTLQARLDQAKLRTDMLNSARFLKAHKLSTGKLGVTGFCWGGSTNFLAVTLGADLQAGVPFYGAAAATAGVPKIKAPLLIQFAETDPSINGMWPAFESALKRPACRTRRTSIRARSTASTTTRRRATTRPRRSSRGTARSRSSRSTSPDRPSHDRETTHGRRQHGLQLRSTVKKDGTLELIARQHATPSRSRKR